MSEINEVRERLTEMANDYLPLATGWDRARDDLRVLLADHARLQADAERLNWMDTHHFLAYRDFDSIDGLSQHCVVVAEEIIPRRGCVNDGIRGAIDAAKELQP